MLRQPFLARRAPAPLRRRVAATILAAASAIALVCAAPRLAEASLTTPAAQTNRAPASFLWSGDTVMKVHADETVEKTATMRIKVLGEAALQAAGQQSVSYHEDTQSLDILEAYTEKADGRKVTVDPTNIMTRDAASGVQLTFLRDLKTRTIIFPDLAVGDTVVLTTRFTIKKNPLSGHFSDVVIYPRAIPFDVMTLRVEAPASVPLQLAAVGDGIDHQILDDAGLRTHVITYRPNGRVAEEPGETSPLDRDPRVLISTFQDWQHLGKSWLEVAGARAQAVTPEIAALAEEITRGIGDRRAQAEAIDRWVKRNIRYVAVYLDAAAGWIPNEPALILRNRYGDCKDHATLMAALLAAKGIDSESVIINAGNAYTLPDVAAQGYHNHMIIYLPEFKLFDDPTAGYAAFGVLAQGDYDKPVVRMSVRGGVHLDRTPAMRAEDHASINRTRISVAADGTMTGETLETGTGMFAMGLRETVATIQHDGAEKSAENFLRIFGTPGKGRFEIGSPSDLAEPYALESTFKLDGKLSTAPGAEQSLPFGLSTRIRPGGYLFNRRFAGRKLPFVCYAGRQVEEIDVTFADGIPFPVALPTKGRRIEDRAFTFMSDYRIENRTLKIRREFVSRVAGQVCAPETETAVAGAMNAVQADLNTRIRFPSPQVAVGKDPAPAQRVDAPAQPKPVRPVEVVAASKPEQRVDPAPADTAANRNWCGGAQEASADLRIHACTAIIQSGQETPLSLAVAFANRGHAYRMKGEHGRAIPDFDQAISLVPNYAAGYNGRGMAWHLARNYDRAIADFNEAIRLNPTFAAAFVNRGNVYRDTSKTDLAMRDFDQAIELDPALAFAWLSRGRALRAAGQHDRAIADFDQAIRLQRSNVVAWNELCYAQTLGGRTAAALESCDQALRLKPNDRFALDYRGLALLKLDELDRAIASWDAALQLYPKEAHALYGRGMAKVRKGDVDGGNADIAAAKAARPQIVQEFARLGLPATDTTAERASASTADVARQMQ